jgi:phosphate transport system permease protein
MNSRKFKQSLWFSLIYLTIFVALLFLLVFLLIIFLKGAKVLSFSFLLESPKEGMTEGGIFPAILGTFYLVLLTTIIALPLGLFSAIYLAEYTKGEFWVGMIRTAIGTLAGVPSIIFGLFGLAVFVNLFGFGVSILSGALTLAVLILPIIINAAEEAIKTVPDSFRQAAYALGATKRQVITKVVLPTAFPNILTGTIISIGRAAGETAPILFTAATFYTRKLPTSIMDEVMALPYHIYALMTEGTAPQKQVPIAYGTAVVLLILVLIVNLIAIIMRARARAQKKW